MLKLALFLMHHSATTLQPHRDANMAVGCCSTFLHYCCCYRVHCPLHLFFQWPVFNANHISPELYFTFFTRSSCSLIFNLALMLHSYHCYTPSYTVRDLLRYWFIFHIHLVALIWLYAKQHYALYRHTVFTDCNAINLIRPAKATHK